MPARNAWSSFQNGTLRFVCDFRYRFDDVQIDLQSFRLLKAGKVTPVEPKALNRLIFLVKNRGRLVERRELIDAVWGDAFVTDHVLNYSIGQLRKGLADDAKNPKYIETVPTLGYRFIAHVEAEPPETADDAPLPSQLERIPQKAPTGQQGSAESSSAPVNGEIASEHPSLLGRYAAVLLVVTLLAVVSSFVLWFERHLSCLLRGAPRFGRWPCFRYRIYRAMLHRIIWPTE